MNVHTYTVYLMFITKSFENVDDIALAHLQNIKEPDIFLLWFGFVNVCVFDKIEPNLGEKIVI